MNGVSLVVNININILVRRNRRSVECSNSSDVELKARVLFKCLSCNYMACYLSYNVKINYTYTADVDEDFIVFFILLICELVLCHWAEVVF